MRLIQTSRLQLAARLSDSKKQQQQQQQYLTAHNRQKTCPRCLCSGLRSSTWAVLSTSRSSVTTPSGRCTSSTRQRGTFMGGRKKKKKRATTDFPFLSHHLYSIDIRDPSKNGILIIIYRQALRYIIRNTTLAPRVRAEAHLQLSQMHCYTNPTQIRNRCILGGKGRGIFSDFKMSRVSLLLLLFWLVVG